ncbi:penicillin-binding protein 2 (plasmid) [Cytobacillus spongiae]|uniref:peptidoglycan D,D-transpeptidase FtsI family protein n=1 Tax=Cytobacillus spongiae TaxID=2901381 RepID=UPI001F3FB53F|nr:penicillin-binding protein 2 [Cytobacillus spongiae]UII58395.1 penicillin-binding protein 2 [Cytobacillus spongiae]
MNKKPPNMNRAGAFLFCTFSLLFSIVFVRFLYIQVTGEIEGKNLVVEASNKYLENHILKANRGTIFDRSEHVLAQDTPSYKIIAILSESVTSNPKKPNHVVNKNRTADVLSRYIKLEKTEIYKLLNNEGKFQVELGAVGNGISTEMKEKIEKEELPGITFLTINRRSYPKGMFASHTIGLTQADAKRNGNTQNEGIMGIEKSLNTYLSGKDGQIRYESDFWGYLLPDSEKTIIPPVDGDDVYLTIDGNIQKILEDALNSVDNEYHPRKMFAIVSDPTTGEILAMAQRPSFNNDTKEGIRDSWSNFIVETSFEPGSTMKSFSLAAAVDSMVFDPQEYYKSGQTFVDGYPSPIKDWNRGKGWGTISYLEGLQRSSNVAFINLLGKIGTDEYYTYLKSFGFGNKTGINLQNEAKGIVQYNNPIERATTIFGQGSTVTALQMIQAGSAIANGGKMMKPYVVSRIVDRDSNKIVKEFHPEVIRSPITKEAADKTREYLTSTVTSDIGTGSKFQLNHFQVSGKSGTAQIPNPNGGGYLTASNEYLFSFLGMAPADDPELIVYVGVQEPDLPPTEIGSIPVSKVFNPVMGDSLMYLKRIKADSKKEL